LESPKQEPVSDQLEVKKVQLHWLLQITKAINYNLPASNLFEIYHSVLKDHLRIGRAVLFVNDGKWHIPVCYGIEGTLPFTDASDATREIEHFKEGVLPAEGWTRQFETMVPVSHKDQHLAYALIGGIDPSVFHSKREIITYLHTITNVIVVAIENKRFAKEAIHQAAVQRELELAAQMQSMLFPANLATPHFTDIAATYIPHQSVGGDYYDFIQLNPDEALVCMADVSGKGLSAAMLMSNFQANLHAIIRHTNFSLTELVSELNDCVNRTAKGEKYITFFAAVMNIRKRTINYINAGHNPPMLVTGHHIEILDKGTTGLGMFDELPFLHSGSAAYQPDSLLFCYTDGITEMENIQGQAFGTDQLGALLLKNKESGSMKDLHEIMVGHFNDFRGSVEYTDDVTFLSLRLPG
jgi:sigma-B regulation protein RsbU (phosphoserine phosphatase)